MPNGFGQVIAGAGPPTLGADVAAGDGAVVVGAVAAGVETGQASHCPGTFWFPQSSTQTVGFPQVSGVPHAGVHFTARVGLQAGVSGLTHFCNGSIQSPTAGSYPGASMPTHLFPFASHSLIAACWRSSCCFWAILTVSGIAKRTTRKARRPKVLE